MLPCRAQATGSGHQRSRGSKPPRIEVFEKSWKRGHRVRLEGPVADVTELGQPVGSLIVKAGSWQLCSRPDFQGDFAKRMAWCVPPTQPD